MTTVLPLIGRGITSGRPCHDIESDSRVATSDREVAGGDGGEDSNVSVTGEEDPGAALDLIDPRTDASDAWCPWPREPSA